MRTVGELINHDAMAMARLGGVSKATKTEISRRARELRTLFATAVRPPWEEPPPAGGDTGAETGGRGLERLAGLLVPARPRSTNEERALRLLVGVDAPPDPVAAPHWPSQTEVAKAVGITGQRVGQMVHRAAERWLGAGELTEVRDEMVALLDANGGVMSAAELAEELIATHGSYRPEPIRTSQATGVVRAAVEAELARGGDARVDIRRYGATVLVGRESADPAATHTAEELLEYAVGLARTAQRLAAADLLPAPRRAIERLRQPVPPPAMPPLPDERLLQLAAAGAGDVAVNAQLQLYPVGLEPRVAVRLSAGSLAVPTGRSLTVDEVRKRVRARFPRAATLPGRPALDRSNHCKLIHEAGVRQEAN